MLRSEPLWAITAFYNPAGYRSRIANFRAFRQHLKIPLVAVEYTLSTRWENRN
ncbi:MAG: hypothetical protein P8M30_11450 [Planctomycetaceae bacterium]|nr:hypothetical protein [Planctomycetaceae bacterium]